MRRLPAPSRVMALALACVMLAARAASAAEGMPQLDVKNPLTLAQVVWLALIFLALYLLLSRWALPQVAAVLEQRAGIIAADLQTARAAKTQADAAVSELTQATREAQAAANARIGEAADRAKADAARQSAEQQARLDGQLAEAERRIGAAREAALGALRQVATETAEAVVARLTGQPADARLVQTEVDAVMAARLAT